MRVKDEASGGDRGGDCAAAHADSALHSLWEGGAVGGMGGGG